MTTRDSRSCSSGVGLLTTVVSRMLFQLKFGSKMSTRSRILSALAASLLLMSGFSHATSFDMRDDQWTLLSVPGDSTGVSVADLFESELASGDYRQSWIVYTFDPAAGAYVEATTSTRLNPGEGFWAIQRSGQDLIIQLPSSLPLATFDGDDACSSATGCFSVTAQQVSGQPATFNMIGSPGRSPTAIRDIRFSSVSGVCQDGCPFEQAVSEGLIVQSLFAFGAGDSVYRLLNGSSSLQVGESVWLGVMDGAGPITIHFPNQMGAELAIDANRSSGDTATDFEFSASFVNSSAVPAGVTYQWSFDGRSASGATLNTRFSAAGLFPVTLEATVNGSVVAAAEATVVVSSIDGDAPSVFQRPDVIADADGDGIGSTLTDYMLTVQAAAGLSSLDDEDRETSVDLDLDSELTGDDAELVGLAVIQNRDLPSRLLDQEPYFPGSVIRVIHPDLQDAGSLLTVQVGSSAPYTIDQPLLGYAGVVIPVDTPIGDTVISIQSNNTEVASFDVTVQALQSSGSSLDDVFEMMSAELDSIIVEAESASEEFYEDNILGDITTGSIAALRQSVEELREIFASPELAPLSQTFASVLLANGLDQVVVRSQNGNLVLDGVDSRATTNDTVCLVIDGLCGVQAVADRLKPLTTAVKGTCLGVDLVVVGGSIATVFSGGTAAPVTAAAAASLLSTCSTATFAISILEFSDELVGGVKFDLALDSEAESGAANSFLLSAHVSASGLDSLCGVVAGQGLDEVTKLIIKRVTQASISSLPLSVRSALRLTAIFSAVGLDVEEALSGGITSLVGEVVKFSGLAEALKDRGGAACNLLGIGTATGRVQVDTAAVGLVAGSGGTLSFTGDKRSRFVCDAGAVNASPINVSASKQFCGVLGRANTSLTCSAAQLTVTFGDNGSLNDDIFEVEVGGEVFTSSSPSRSVTGTVEVPPGSIQSVIMRGRAAPDGIGTYFIRFEGGTQVSGDPTSGSDLTPGRVKRFEVQVDGAMP